MNGLLEKLIKRTNKKKGKNIKTATVVAFLLSCVTVMGAETGNNYDEYLGIYNNGITVTENTNFKGYINSDESYGIVIRDQNVTVNNYGTTRGISMVDNGVVNATVNNFGKVLGEKFAFSSTSIKNKPSISNYGTAFGENLKSPEISGIDNYGVVGVTEGTSLSGNNNKGITFVISKGEDGSLKYNIDGDINSSNEKVNINIDNEEKEYTIKNATKADEVKGTNSIELSENEYSNIIFNGINDTVKISGDKTINNSIVNAFGNAIVFDENGGTLNLSGTTVNGGGKISFVDNKGYETIYSSSNSGAILGSQNADTLNLSGSYVNGDINLEDGNDNIKISDKTIINGNINLGAGDDSLIISSIDNIFNGKVDGGAGSNKIVLEYQVTEENSQNLRDILNKVNKFGELKFADNGNIINLDKINFAGKYVGGTGNDEFIVSSLRNLEIDGNDGKDTLKITNAINSQNNIFENVSNIENLVLSNNNNIINISGSEFTNIIGGDLSDEFILTENSNINLKGGAGENILYLNNTTNGIDFNGTLGEAGERWTLKIDNVDNSINISNKNIKTENIDLMVKNKVDSEEGTTNLVNILNSSGISKVNLSREQNILTFKDTTLNKETVFHGYSTNQINMNGNISGIYNFYTLDYYSPTVNISSDTIFADDTKITSNKDSINIDIDNGTGTFVLGNFNYSNDSLTFVGVNPFDSSKKYNITGNIKLGFDDLTLSENVLNGGTIAISNNNYNGNINIKNGHFEIPAFLKYNGNGFAIKDWEELNSNLDAKHYGNVYKGILKEYNTDNSIKNILNNWDKSSIIDYVMNGHNKIYSWVSVEDTYNNVGISSETVGDFKLTTGNEKNTDLTINNLSSGKDMIIELGSAEKNNVSINGNINILGKIDLSLSSAENINLSVNGNNKNSSFVHEIIGRDGKDDISLSNISIKNEGTLGNIDLKSGDDKLSFDNVIAGELNGNSGNKNIDIKNSNLESINISGGNLDIKSSDIKDISFTEKTELKVEGNSNIGNITFENGDNILTVKDSNIESATFGAGNDTINILSNINMILDGGTGNNILNIGENSKLSKVLSGGNKEYLTISGEYKNFGTVNIDTDTKLASDLKISNGDSKTEIIINSGNELMIGIDYNQKDENGVVIGNALHKNENIVIDNNAGKIVIDVLDAAGETIISFGGNLKDKIENDKNIISGNSIANEVKFDENGNIIVTVKDEILKNEYYNDFAKAVSEVGKMGNILDGININEQSGELTKYAEDVIYNSPYSYSHKISRKTAEIINNNILENNLGTEINEWKAYGNIFGGNKSIDDYDYSILNNNSNLDSNIYGAFVQVEYGYRENTSIGYVVAGNKSDTEIGDSTLKGNGFYIGSYIKHDILNNLSLTFGVGYQHTYYDSTRKASNNYTSFSHDEKYSDDVFTTYFGGRYFYNISENISIEPYANLNFTYVMQDSIDEGTSENITIKTEDKNFTSLNGELGVDVSKKITLEKGNLKLKAGLGILQKLDGYDNEYIETKISGGNSGFDIISPKEDKTNGKVKVGAEFERENGIIYNLDINYIASSGEKEYIVGFGVGYKF